MSDISMKEKGFERISLYFPFLEDYYYINNTGKVYSTFTNRYLTPGIDKDGYYRQTFIAKPNKDYKIKLMGIHRIVNCIFNGFPPSGLNNPVTDHIDGNKTNNYYKNLRWISNRENSSYSFRHLGIKSVLEDTDVLHIYEDYKNNITIQQIADKYGTNYKYIYAILSGTKRVAAIEKYNLIPLIKSKPFVDEETVREIAFKLMDSNKTKQQIADEMNISSSTLAHIAYKEAWAQETEEFNFQDRTTTMFNNNIPDIDLSCDEIIIGDTEYCVSNDWNGGEL